MQTCNKYRKHNLKCSEIIMSLCMETLEINFEKLYLTRHTAIL